MCAALLVGDRPSSLPILEFVSKAASPAKKGDRIFSCCGEGIAWNDDHVGGFPCGHFCDRASSSQHAVRKQHDHIDAGRKIAPFRSLRRAQERAAALDCSA